MEPDRDLTAVPDGSAVTEPRVLLVEGALRENGGLRVSHDLAVRWTRDGLPVTFLVLETVDQPPLLTPDPSLRTVFASPEAVRFRRSLPRVVRGLLREARRSDVVVSGSEVGYGVLLGLPVARLLRKKYVVLVQAVLGPAVEVWRPRRLQRLLLAAHRRVDLAVCVSPGVAQSVVANGLPADKVRVVDVGVDVDGVQRKAGAGLPRQSPADTGDQPVRRRPVVVAVGRLTETKGFDLLVRAHALALGRGADHVLRIMGEGPERVALEELVRELGVEGSVELTGFQSNPYPSMAAADLFVLSSRSEGSGGLVLLEALALQVPVVAADCPTGPRRLLADGRYGRLVPAEDVHELADAIVDHLRDPQVLRAKAAHGPERARSFSPERTAQQLHRLLRATAGFPVEAAPRTPLPLTPEPAVRLVLPAEDPVATR